jgi:hypothetical protein
MVDNAQIEGVDVESSHFECFHVMVDNAHMMVVDHAHMDHTMMDNAHMIVFASSTAVDPLVSLHITMIALVADNDHP